ncbi:EscU/YscU/HrcU family type III secretion system export apparatus switch protein [Candidatus Acidulodesulfobacterium sp. H_13]|uniref:EscU/YscU/HrcU family type III secretion system export apparatus switch protein n=1 Tax=Candidatus Acidulodesulfobacterium sp. H_13 TaxID=3395470 RepID=UPI003AF9AD31
MKEFKTDKNIKASALKYDGEKNSAPVLIAKGRGRVAEKIIEIAKKENIPVMENKMLADVLDRLDIYDEIPPELYKAVSKIFAFLWKVNEKAAGDSRNF